MLRTQRIEARQGLIHARHDIVICEAHRLQAKSGKRSVTLGVIFCAIGVCASVNLDNEPRRVAIEINDEALDDLLATKPQAQ